MDVQAFPDRLICLRIATEDFPELLTKEDIREFLDIIDNLNSSSAQVIQYSLGDSKHPIVLVVSLISCQEDLRGCDC